jgi:hypothetical protein
VDLNGAANDSLSQGLDFCRSGSHVRCGARSAPIGFLMVSREKMSEVGGSSDGAGRQTLHKLPRLDRSGFLNTETALDLLALCQRVIHPLHEQFVQDYRSTASTLLAAVALLAVRGVRERRERDARARAGSRGSPWGVGRSPS